MYDLVQYLNSTTSRKCVSHVFSLYSTIYFPFHPFQDCSRGYKTPAFQTVTQIWDSLLVKRQEEAKWVHYWAF